MTEKIDWGTIMMLCCIVGLLLFIMIALAYSTIQTGIDQSDYKDNQECFDSLAQEQCIQRGFEQSAKINGQGFRCREDARTPEETFFIWIKGDCGRE